MKLELTERDKTLLIFLDVLLIAAAYLFLGILPLHRANYDMLAQLESAEADMEEKEKKIAGLAEVSSVHDELEKALEQAQTAMLPMMESREIDRILTGLALEYGLSVRRMEIQMPEEASDLPAFGETKGKKSAAGNNEGADSVYHALVSMEVVGSQTDGDRLLDAVSQNMTGIRIISMRRISAKSHSAADSGSGEDVLELKLEVSMCRKAAE
ncbi:MAG: hypothetical protein Q4F76_08625 [Lachnospiraceae bacterium]|nr:hypothetical protein [Lachnospiraceae bacterium]